MYADADKRLKDLKHLNQYNNSGVEAAMATGESDGDYRCDECINLGISCKFPIFADNIQWCEKDYIENKKTKGGAAFFKLKDDPRITRIGKFIRNTSIDELPQLWNVLKGEMSLIGPRPEREDIVEQYAIQNNFYRMRHIIKPGITGWAQVNNPTATPEETIEKLEYDLFYINNLSIRLELQILLRTIGVVSSLESL